MMADPLADLAAAAGIAIHTLDAFGRPHEVPPPTLRAVLAAVGLPAATDAQVAGSLASLRQPLALPLLVTAAAGEAAIVPAATGRYRLRLESGGATEGVFAPDDTGRMRGPAVTEPGYHHLQTANGEVVLAVAPPRCWGMGDVAPDLQAGGRLWGLSVPVYGLRRADDGGLGDYTALAQMAAAAGGRGAAALAMSPVHAAFAADPGRFSPYSPSTRQFLNVFYIDPDHLPFGLPTPPPAAAVPAGPLIDWSAAGGARLARLRAAFDAFPAAPDAARAAFAAFRAARGETLERHARFEALAAHFLAQDPPLRVWQDWPAEFRDPASLEVAAFAAGHATEVAFHAFLQFLADAGLAAAQAAARAAGRAIGLISDLAVGTDRAIAPRCCPALPSVRRPTY
jgi:4-alpha-glucanotransferase